MGEARFWRPKRSFINFNIKSLFKRKNRSVASLVANSSKGPKFTFKNLVKRFGMVGVVVLGIIAVLAILGFVFIIKPSYSVLASANIVKKDVDLAREAFRNQDIDGLQQSLEKTKKDIGLLRDSRDQNFKWAKNFSLTKDYYMDSEHFMNAGVIADEALVEFVTVVTPFADAAGFKSKKTVEVRDPNAGSGFADAFAGWVRIMPEVADKMDGVINKFDKVGDELSKVDAKRYPESFKGFPIRSNIEAAQQYLTKASEFGPDIKAALTAIPPILGVLEEKRYAIIMQNSAELRPTGGFWTNYATFRVKDALLNSDFTSKDMYSIDEIIATTDTIYTSPFPKPYPPYRDFLKVEHTYARDANFSPDFITAIDAWMWYYRKAALIMPSEAKPINGVFAIDTRVVSDLLRVTGPVTVDGVEYDSESVVLELERIASLGLREQQGRKKVLGNVMEGMLIKMYKSEKNLWPKFVDAVLKLATEKHILAYIFDDTKAQELIEKYNFGGRIINYDKGDFSYVVSTNLGGDKTNIFVVKNVDHKVYTEGSKWMREVNITFKYGPAKPGYEQLVKVYRDWVRVYAPAGSELVSLDGSDAKTESDLGEERGKVYFAGHITLNPGQTTAIKFKYELPENIVKNRMYSIYIEKQPGTLMDVHTVTFGGKTQNVNLLTDKELFFESNGK